LTVPLVLKKQKGVVAHLNVRSEKHGEEEVLAVDVKVQADVSNKLLDELSPGMRSALYAREGAAAGETPDMDEDHLTQLRFPQLAPLKWKVGMVGGRFVVHGVKKADDLEFEGDVKEATLALKEGGTVELTLSCAVLPTPEQAGTLSGLLGQDARVSLSPVEQPAQPPLES
jgi:hypothetical protein